MKKTFLFIITISLFIACSSPSPQKVAQNYVENIAKGDIWEAKKYVTESTDEILTSMVKYTIVEINPDFKFNFIKDSIVGDKAWVKYTDEKNVEGIIPLTKINGAWKVDI